MPATTATKEPARVYVYIERKPGQDWETKVHLKPLKTPPRADVKRVGPLTAAQAIGELAKLRDLPCQSKLPLGPIDPAE